MSKALYRKYRSKKLSEIVGQEHITRTLDNALKTGRISHAYLFTGPRGVGKTSIARILAHEINQLPYTDESIHMDIIEIDAASNRRIDEIRDLRDKVHIAPTSAKYKVYVIDEVHMLTREAFNALLKTLEEPPAHVVFILATTEVHKLPETIVSRTQRFTFKPIEEADAVKHLASIAKAEGIKVDEDALKLLAAHGRGSFRDSISLLDQVGGSSSKITKSDVEKTLGLAADEHLDRLLDSALNGSPADVVASLEALTVDGISPSQAAKQLASKLRAQIMKGQASQALIDLLGDLLGVQSANEPTAALEIALFKANLASNPNIQIQSIKQTKTEPAIVETESIAEAVDPKDSIEQPEEANAKPTIQGDLAGWWPQVLEYIKASNNTLYGMLRMAKPVIDGDTLHLSFGFGFHKKKADDVDTKSKIHDAVTKVSGQSYQINTIHDKNLSKEAQKPEIAATIETADTSSDIDTITNIFGGGEVLES